MNKKQKSKSLELLLAIGLATTSIASVNASEIKTSINESSKTSSYLIAQELTEGEKANKDFKDKIWQQ